MLQISNYRRGLHLNDSSGSESINRSSSLIEILLYFFHALYFSFSLKFSLSKDHLEPCRYCKVFCFVFFFCFYPWCTGSHWRGFSWTCRDQGKEGRPVPWQLHWSKWEAMEAWSDQGGRWWRWWECYDLFIWCVRVLSRVQLLVTSWTVACQVPLSMGYFRQEYWSGLPYPPPIYLEAALNEFIDRPDVFCKKKSPGWWQDFWPEQLEGRAASSWEGKALREIGHQGVMEWWRQ